MNLHFLAQRSNVSAGLNDPLASVVMLVELIPEALKHRDDRAGSFGSHGISVLCDRLALPGSFGAHCM